MIQNRKDRPYGLSVWRAAAVLVTALCFYIQAGAQDPLVEGRRFAEAGEYGKAIELYQKLYDQTPSDPEVYRDYLETLLAAKKYKDAEKLVKHQMDISHQHPVFYIDLGEVYRLAGKGKKAEAQFQAAIDQVNGDDMLTQQIARAFVRTGNDAYTIKTYEHARGILRNPYMYYAPLARLYAKTGDIEKAVYTLLDGGIGNMRGIEDTKATLLELTGTDPGNIRLAQKALVKRINADPENIYYGDLLTWVYTQKDDWDGAFIQIRAIDERNREHGRRILDFAHNARRASRYDAALKALDAITEKGRDQPLYDAAMAEKLNVHMRRLEQEPAYAIPEITRAIRNEYRDFFTVYPQYVTSVTLLDYALLEAQYNDEVKAAIDLLENAIAQPAARKDFVGRAKLQLGDYYVLSGRIWDAALTYGQVDKAFREDILGEEARFRNAKLAYYRGDFAWAQSQLSVLKASTSELIANDALYLSVLITENVTPDSNLVPLDRFAFADLLLFQHKYTEATALLDSITAAFPRHPLNDDILMLHARIAEKHKEYHKALDYLRQVYTRYSTDVLADDALFRSGEICEKSLKQQKEAIDFYERLILEYPGSTYVQTARERLRLLQRTSPEL